MTAELAAVCDRELAGDAPGWVQLFPAGEMTARDGRRFNLADPQAVMRAFAADAVDLPIDYEHQADAKPEARSGPVPAAGWIKELKADASGLWGRVEWTAQARALIAGKAYRYLSPSFFYTRAGNIITRLKGAGLVHRPALHLHALAGQESDMKDPDPLLQRLTAALGLAADATEDDLIALIETLRGQAEAATAARMPDPARFVPIAAVQELMRDRADLRHAQTRERGAAKVTEALARGYITPAMKVWAQDLCARNEAAFDAFLASSAPAYAHLTRPALPDGPPPGGRAPLAQSDAAAVVCAQLGLTPGSLAE